MCLSFEKTPFCVLARRIVVPEYERASPVATGHCRRVPLVDNRASEISLHSHKKGLSHIPGFQRR